MFNSICRATIFLFLFPASIFSQNLVANGGFETVISCPISMARLNYATGWFKPNLGSTDLLHTCCPVTFGAQPPNTGLGFQHPRTGNGMAGFVAFVQSSPNQREYMMTALTAPLTAGQVYEVTAFVNLPEYCNRSCSNIEFFFSNGPISAPTVSAMTAFVPQVSNPVGNFINDSILWTAVSGTFTAAGGEDHLTIGNFKDDANTSLAVNPNLDPNSPITISFAYYFVDDICVHPIGSPACTTVLPFEGVALEVSEGNPGTAILTWEGTGSKSVRNFRIERGENPSDLVELVLLPAEDDWKSRPQGFTDLLPQPGANWYRVVQENEDGSEVVSNRVRFTSTPSGQILVKMGRVASRLEIEVSKACRVRLFDLGGRELRRATVLAHETSTRISMEGLATGIYLLSLTTSDGIQEHHKFSTGLMQGN